MSSPKKYKSLNQKFSRSGIMKKYHALQRNFEIYKIECEKNGVIAREFEDWKEYYNIEKGQ